MQRDDSAYLRHIMDSIARIETYLLGIDEAKFLRVSLIQDGVIRQLEVVGEAVKLLSEEMRAKHPHVPWQDIAGMRDKLIHGYFGVDLEKVWLTARDDLPQLKAAVGEMLRSIDSP